MVGIIECRGHCGFFYLSLYFHHHTFFPLMKTARIWYILIWSIPFFVSANPIALTLWNRLRAVIIVVANSSLGFKCTHARLASTLDFFFLGIKPKIYQTIRLPFTPPYSIGNIFKNHFHILLLICHILNNKLKTFSHWSLSFIMRKL